jgi:cysteine desulfurase family protein (TIGR01976 family)
MTESSFPLDWIRRQFPALQLRINDRPAVFLDGPGGTQVPSGVIEAVTGYYRNQNSNLGGHFATSHWTSEVVSGARSAVAEFLHAREPEEIVFGPNMTTLTFAFSRALARSWHAGDEVIVTSLDHDANVTPWRLAAHDRDVRVKTWEVDPETCTLPLSGLRSLLSERTRLLAVGLASNAVGSHVDVSGAVKMMHEVGAKVFVDAVHYAPHGPIDVQALDCDLLACSAYKFFGPHLGILWGRRDLLEHLDSYKVRPASNSSPGKWETGTQNFEGIAGTLAALEYLRVLGSQTTGEPQLRATLETIQKYESRLSRHFLEGVSSLREARIFGLTGLNEVARRTPTFALRLTAHSPEQVARKLGERSIFVWNGHFYALDLINRLGLENSGGVVRIGFVHYNTIEEVDRVLEELAAFA